MRRGRQSVGRLYDPPVIAHKIRLDPSDAQARLFAVWAEASRRAWNWALSEWERQHLDRIGGQRFKRVGRSGLVPVGEPWSPDPERPAPSAASLSRLLTEVRREAPLGTMWWMRPPIPARVYRQPIRDLAAAWSAFHRRRALGLRRGNPSNPFGGPVPKRTEAPLSFYFSGQDIEIDGGYVELPFGHRVRLREAPRFRGRVVGSTFSEQAGCWSVALTVEFERRRQAPPTETHAGIWLGTEILATIGTRTAEASPDGAGSGRTLFEASRPGAYARDLRRLRRLAKDVSRKMRGSHNRRKAIQRLRKHHARLVNLRRDTLHKLTTAVVRRVASMGIEDAASVMESESASRAVAELGLYEFQRQIDYKAAEAGVEITVADKGFASARHCSACGARNQASKERSRGARRWRCERCGVEHDRDRNAAVNLDPVSFGTGTSGPELPVQ